MASASHLPHSAVARAWDWDTDGLRVIPDFVDPQTCRRLRERAATLVSARRKAAPRVVFETQHQTHAKDDHFASSGGEIRLFFEDEDPEQINKIGHALHDLDETFSAFSRQPRLAALIAELGVAAPRLVQSMYIFKPPGIGGAVQIHQDATFLRTEPTSVIGLWFALHDADRNNGCLWALPGHHRAPVRTLFGYDASGELGMTVRDPRPWPITEAIPLEVSMGTLVILHGRLPHFSHVNRSPQPREAYTLHLIDGTTQWSEANWLRRSEPFRGFLPQETNCKKT